MSRGGMLALKGDADDSIQDFLGLVSPFQGTDAIQYWNGSAWDNIANATAGIDYSLEYLSTGDLTGYTLLTVTAVPEPASLALLLVGLFGLLLVLHRQPNSDRRMADYG